MRIKRFFAYFVLAMILSALALFSGCTYYNVQSSENKNSTAGGLDAAALSVVSINSTFSLYDSGKTTLQGAGVVYSVDTETWDTYILTNYHVVYDLSSAGLENITHVSDDISVWLFGGERSEGRLSATFVGGAIDYDVAVLFIDGDAIVEGNNGETHTNASVLQNSAVRPITIANSDEITVGDEVYAVGNPNGEGIAASRGIVSVAAEYITMTALNSVRRKVDFLEMRIDAAVNHGNSGGGLFNAKGEYIGTVNARSEESGVRDFGYAIPSNLTVAIARNVIACNNNGALIAELGFTTMVSASRSVYDEDIGKAYIEETVYVTGVYVDTVADDVILPNDVLIAYELNGVSVPITHEYQLTFLRFNLRTGDEVKFEVDRYGTNTTVTLVFGAEFFSLIK